MSWIVSALSIWLAAFGQAAFAGGPTEGANPKNGLSSEAFRLNTLTTNKEALRILLANPLNDNLFMVEEGYIGRQLSDPGASAMMTELIKCALGSSTTLTYDDKTWHGELGLCQPKDADPSLGNWYTDAPTVPCQEIVTACIMARVNGIGRAIPLSLRSEHPGLSPLFPKILTETKTREDPLGQDPSEGGLIRSFGTGPHGCVTLECGWRPGHVGRCNGGRIKLAIDNAVCSSMRLRVCNGIHGCVSPDLVVAPNFSTPEPPYSQFNTDKVGACRNSPLEFDCPTHNNFRGYYSVMFSSPPGEIQQPPVVSLNDDGYPATEGDVFRFPEGAFYGNLFDPANLRRSCEVNNGWLRCTGYNEVSRIDYLHNNPDLPYSRVYACYTYQQHNETISDARLGAAVLNSRFCNSASLESKCFPNTPKRCYDEQVSDSPCDPAGDDGIYKRCKGRGEDTKAYAQIITTYLNDPCDLINKDHSIGVGEVSSVSLCTAVREDIDGRTGPICTCSSRGTGGLLQWISVAAGVALLLRRQRRRRVG